MWGAVNEPVDDLLLQCSSARNAGADFPTVWNEVLKGHRLVAGPPLSRMCDGEAVLEVPLLTGQRIVYSAKGYSL